MEICIFLLGFIMPKIVLLLDMANKWSLSAENDLKFNSNEFKNWKQLKIYTICKTCAKKAKTILPGFCQKNLRFSKPWKKKSLNRSVLLTLSYNAVRFQKYRSVFLIKCWKRGIKWVLRVSLQLSEEHIRSQYVNDAYAQITLTQSTLSFRGPALTSHKSMRKSIPGEFVAFTRVDK